MRHTTLPLEGMSLKRLLAAAKGRKAVFLTRNRKVRFVLMPADDGDQEVYALENSPKFLAYMKDAMERAKTGKRSSLAEVRAMFATSH